jgi:hypothetical protein
MNKQINQQNWLDQDPAMAIYDKVDLTTGTAEPARGEDWLDVVLQLQLQSSVPQEVQELFEQARGALVYGYFYYPLYTLGMIEVYRVAEAAVAHKCKELNVSPSSRKYGATFDENIQELARRGVLQPADWAGIRSARNFGSHLKEQMIIVPAMAIMAVQQVVEKINALFPVQSS